MQIDSVTNSSLLANSLDKTKSNTNIQDVADFSEFLKNNFSKIDSDEDNNLSVAEINEITKNMDLGNLSDMITKLDLNNDSQISLAELEKDDSLKTTVSETVKGIIDGVAKSETANSLLTNAVGRLSNVYKMNSLSSNLVSSLVEKII